MYRYFYCSDLNFFDNNNNNNNDGDDEEDGVCTSIIIVGRRKRAKWAWYNEVWREEHIAPSLASSNNVNVNQSRMRFTQHKEICGRSCGVFE